MKKIALVMAMHSEADRLIHELQLTQKNSNGFNDLYFGQLDELEIILAIPSIDERSKRDSIGTEPAAIATYDVVLNHSPELVISAGTAGSFARRGASIGKVYLSRDKFYYHDHSIPMPGWKEYGLGGYPSANTSLISRELGIEMANVSSGNSLDFTQHQLELIERSGALLKEMEACSVAWVCQKMKVPMFAIKSVTNLIDVNADSPSEFERNFPMAASSLAAETMKVLKLLQTTSVESLTRAH